ncbi:MAG: hypothetical protein QM796_14580 [Chthoniobacteraceae bacterium]
MKTILLLAALLLAASLHAQDTKEQLEKPPLPAGPIIKPLPPLAQWAVVFVAPQSTKEKKPVKTEADQNGTSGAAKAPPSHPRSIVITKSGNTYREVENDNNGGKWERWRVNGMEVSLTADGKVAISAGAPSDFDELKWISPSNYLGVANVGEEKCFIFQSKISIPDVGEVQVTAGVSVATQMPVYYVEGGSPQLYKFGVPPQAPLAVPAIVQMALAKRKQLVDGLVRHP